jgi:hypothetical protein
MDGFFKKPLGQSLSPAFGLPIRLPTLAFEETQRRPIPVGFLRAQEQRRPAKE